TMLDQPGIGSLPTPGSPVNSTAFDRSPPQPAPRLGQHSNAILADVLGMPSGAIAALVDRKIIRV
ncbi:MAG: 2-methylfumaryl-CoA isomerase, partial [Paracoccaceae bacterium]